MKENEIFVKTETYYGKISTFVKVPDSFDRKEEVLLENMVQRVQYALVKYIADITPSIGTLGPESMDSMMYCFIDIIQEEVIENPRD